MLADDCSVNDLSDRGEDERITLRLILTRQSVMMAGGRNWLRVSGSFPMSGAEPLGSAASVFLNRTITVGDNPVGFSGKPTDFLLSCYEDDEDSSKRRKCR